MQIYTFLSTVLLIQVLNTRGHSEIRLHPARRFYHSQRNIYSDSLSEASRNIHDPRISITNSRTVQDIYTIHINQKHSRSPVIVKILNINKRSTSQSSSEESGSNEEMRYSKKTRSYRKTRKKSARKRKENTSSPEEDHEGNISDDTKHSGYSNHYKMERRSGRVTTKHEDERRNYKRSTHSEESDDSEEGDTNENESGKSYTKETEESDTHETEESISTQVESNSNEASETNESIDTNETETDETEETEENISNKSSKFKPAKIKDDKGSGRSSARIEEIPPLRKKNPYLEKICPEEGFFPDLYTCKRFHYCGKFNVTHHTCSFGVSYYDPVRHDCTIASSGICYRFDCYRQANRSIAYEGDKQIYATCIRNRAFSLKRCPKGMLFVEKYQECQHDPGYNRSLEFTYNIPRKSTEVKDQYNHTYNSRNNTGGLTTAESQHNNIFEKEFDGDNQNEHRPSSHKIPSRDEEVNGFTVSHYKYQTPFNSKNYGETQNTKQSSFHEPYTQRPPAAVENTYSTLGPINATTTHRVTRGYFHSTSPNPTTKRPPSIVPFSRTTSAINNTREKSTSNSVEVTVPIKPMEMSSNSEVLAEEKSRKSTVMPTGKYPFSIASSTQSSAMQIGDKIESSTEFIASGETESPTTLSNASTYISKTERFDSINEDIIHSHTLNSQSYATPGTLINEILYRPTDADIVSQNNNTTGKIYDLSLSTVTLVYSTQPIGGLVYRPNGNPRQKNTEEQFSDSTSVLPIPREELNVTSDLSLLANQNNTSAIGNEVQESSDNSVKETIKVSSTTKNLLNIIPSTFPKPTNEMKITLDFTQPAIILQHEATTLPYTDDSILENESVHSRYSEGLLGPTSVSNLNNPNIDEVIPKRNENKDEKLNINLISTTAGLQRDLSLSPTSHANYESSLDKNEIINKTSITGNNSKVTMQISYSAMSDIVEIAIPISGDMEVTTTEVGSKFSRALTTKFPTYLTPAPKNNVVDNIKYESTGITLGSTKNTPVTVSRDMGWVYSKVNAPEKLISDNQEIGTEYPKDTSLSQAEDFIRTEKPFTSPPIPSSEGSPDKYINKFEELEMSTYPNDSKEWDSTINSNVLDNFTSEAGYNSDHLSNSDRSEVEENIYHNLNSSETKSTYVLGNNTDEDNYVNMTPVIITDNITTYGNHGYNTSNANDYEILHISENSSSTFPNIDSNQKIKPTMVVRRTSFFEEFGRTGEEDMISSIPAGKLTNNNIGNITGLNYNRESSMKPDSLNEQYSNKTQYSENADANKDSIDSSLVNVDIINNSVGKEKQENVNEQSSKTISHESLPPESTARTEKLHSITPTLEKITPSILEASITSSPIDVGLFRYHMTEFESKEQTNNNDNMVPTAALPTTVEDIYSVTNADSNSLTQPTIDSNTNYKTVSWKLFDKFTNKSNGFVMDRERGEFNISHFENYNDSIISITNDSQPLETATTDNNWLIAPSNQETHFEIESNSSAHEHSNNLVTDSSKTLPHERSMIDKTREPNAGSTIISEPISFTAMPEDNSGADKLLDTITVKSYDNVTVQGTPNTTLDNLLLISTETSITTMQHAEYSGMAGSVVNDNITKESNTATYKYNIEKNKTSENSDGNAKSFVTSSDTIPPNNKINTSTESTTTDDIINASNSIAYPEDSPIIVVEVTNTPIINATLGTINFDKLSKNMNTETTTPIPYRSEGDVTSGSLSSTTLNFSVNLSSSIEDSMISPETGTKSGVVTPRTTSNAIYTTKTSPKDVQFTPMAEGRSRMDELNFFPSTNTFESTLLTFIYSGGGSDSVSETQSTSTEEPTRFEIFSYNSPARLSESALSDVPRSHNTSASETNAYISEDTYISEAASRHGLENHTTNALNILPNGYDSSNAEEGSASIEPGNPTTSSSENMPTRVTETPLAVTHENVRSFISVDLSIDAPEKPLKSVFHNSETITPENSSTISIEYDRTTVSKDLSMNLAETPSTSIRDITQISAYDGLSSRTPETHPATSKEPPSSISDNLTTIELFILGNPTTVTSENSGTDSSETQSAVTSDNLSIAATESPLTRELPTNKPEIPTIDASEEQSSSATDNPATISSENPSTNSSVYLPVRILENPLTNPKEAKLTSPAERSSIVTIEQLSTAMTKNDTSFKSVSTTENHPTRISETLPTSSSEIVSTNELEKSSANQPEISSASTPESHSISPEKPSTDVSDESTTNLPTNISETLATSSSEILSARESLNSLPIQTGSPLISTLTSHLISPFDNVSTSTPENLSTGVSRYSSTISSRNSEKPSTSSSESLKIGLENTLNNPPEVSLTSAPDSHSITVLDNILATVQENTSTDKTIEPSTMIPEKPSTSTSERHLNSSSEYVQNVVSGIPGNNTPRTAGNHPKSVSENPITGPSENLLTRAPEKPRKNAPESVSISQLEKMSTSITENPSAYVSEKYSSSLSVNPSTHTSEKRSKSTSDTFPISELHNTSTGTLKNTSTTLPESTSMSGLEHISTGKAENSPSDVSDESSISATMNSLGTFEKPSTIASVHNPTRLAQNTLTGTPDTHLASPTESSVISGLENISTSMTNNPSADVANEVLTTASENHISIYANRLTIYSEKVTTRVLETSSTIQPETSTIERLSISEFETPSSDAVQKHSTTSVNPPKSTLEKISTGTSDSFLTKELQNTLTYTLQTPLTTSPESSSTSTPEKPYFSENPPGRKMDNPQVSSSENLSISSSEHSSLNVTETFSNSTTVNHSSSTPIYRSNIASEIPQRSASENPPFVTSDNPSRSASEATVIRTLDNSSTNVSEKPLTNALENPVPFKTEFSSRISLETSHTSTLETYSTSAFQSFPEFEISKSSFDGFGIKNSQTPVDVSDNAHMFGYTTESTLNDNTLVIESGDSSTVAYEQNNSETSTTEQYTLLPLNMSASPTNPSSSSKMKFDSPFERTSQLPEETTRSEPKQVTSLVTSSTYQQGIETLSNSINSRPSEIKPADGLSTATAKIPKSSSSLTNIASIGENPTGQYVVMHYNSETEETIPVSSSSTANKLTDLLVNELTRLSFSPYIIKRTWPPLSSTTSLAVVTTTVSPESTHTNVDRKEFIEPTPSFEISTPTARVVTSTTQAIPTTQATTSTTEDPSEALLDILVNNLKFFLG